MCFLVGASVAVDADGAVGSFRHRAVASSALGALRSLGVPRFPRALRASRVSLALGAAHISSALGATHFSGASCASYLPRAFRAAHIARASWTLQRGARTVVTISMRVDRGLRHKSSISRSCASVRVHRRLVWAGNRPQATSRRMLTRDNRAMRHEARAS